MPIHIGTQHTPFELDVQVEALSVFETTQNRMEKKSSAAAWNWKWGHKLGPENYFPLPEIYSETGFERLRVPV